MLFRSSLSNLWRLHTFTQTGISGNTLMYIFAPLIAFNFRLSTSYAEVSCFAVSRIPLPFILMPHSPKASVVPLVEPPVGIGITPLCRRMYLMRVGASCDRNRTKLSPGSGFGCKLNCERVTLVERHDDSNDRANENMMEAGQMAARGHSAHRSTIDAWTQWASRVTVDGYGL